ncbi:MAG: HTTM domain-containing protein [Pirellulales bacterium]
MTPWWSWRKVAELWQRFFHEPVDTLPCDLLRIGYALILLVYCLAAWPYVITWYGAGGVYPLDVSRQLIDPDCLTLFQWLPNTNMTAVIGMGLLTLHSLLLLVGVASTWQAIGAYVWLVSFNHRNLLILDAEDSVLRILSFLMMLMPLGNYLSWDSWRRHGRLWGGEPTCRPCWALRLWQLEMCLIFLGCAYSKAQGDYWLDGRALFYASRLDDLFDRFPSPAFLWETMPLLKWMGWMVILLELSAPILIWFRETRTWTLVVLILFHLAIDYTMNLFLFHWIMIAGWLTFVSADAWRAAVARVAGWADAGKLTPNGWPSGTQPPPAGHRMSGLPDRLGG